VAALAHAGDEYREVEGGEQVEFEHLADGLVVGLPRLVKANPALLIDACDRSGREVAAMSCWRKRGLVRSPARVKWVGWGAMERAVRARQAPRWASSLARA
jgi:hypothetical protein